MIMKLHPRHSAVEKARHGIAAYVVGVVEAHDLTALEVMGILLQEASQYQLFALRQERHPCCSGPADIVCECEKPVVTP